MKAEIEYFKAGYKTNVESDQTKRKTFVEIVINSFEAVRRILQIIHRSNEMCKVIRKYTLIVLFTGISLVYFLDMFYIQMRDDVSEDESDYEPDEAVDPDPEQPNPC